MSSGGREAGAGSVLLWCRCVLARSYCDSPDAGGLARDADIGSTPGSRSPPVLPTPGLAAHAQTSGGRSDVSFRLQATAQ